MSMLLELAERAKGLGKRVAVAAAHDEDALEAVVSAADDGVCGALLTGDEVRIRAMLAALGTAPDRFEIVDCADDESCAKAAVQAALENCADMLMKGRLSTAALMREVVHSELLTGRLLSHVMLYELPGFPRLLADTDGGLNPAPDLEKKQAILENAARFLLSIGYERIVAACLSGSETVSQKIPSSTDARALAAMDWSHLSMTVFGPVGLDLAVSPEACAHKGYDAPGAGRADILLMPSLEAGNFLGKALTYFAGARSAGLIVGARCPIVLVSRADSAETKRVSLAIGALASKGGTL